LCAIPEHKTIDYKKFKLSTVGECVIFYWEGPIPVLETFFFLKSLEVYDNPHFTTIVEKSIPLNKSFIQRCSFAKYLECLYVITYPDVEINGLSAYADKEVDLETLISRIDAGVCSYHKRVSCRKFS